VATVRFGDFEWDDDKARENAKKHGVTFNGGGAVLSRPTRRRSRGRSLSSSAWLLAGLTLAACAGSRQPMRPTAKAGCQGDDLDAEALLGNPRPDPAGPLCSREQLRSAREVDDLDDDYFEGAHYGQRVVLRGRSILGGVCCLGCWGCAASIALGSGPGTDATPAAGRIAFLTAAQLASQGQRFNDAQWSGFTQSCPWSKDRYCCRSPRLGRDVVVTGRMIAPPDVKPGTVPEQNCTGSLPSLLSPQFPRCEFTVPWRSEIDQVAAMAVESVCRVSTSTAPD
jgi:hypothetical protein